MPDDDRTLDQLVAQHLDDALDAESAARLHDQLRSDVQARRLLLAASRHASALPRLVLEAGLAKPVTSAVTPARHRARDWLMPAAAAAIVLVTIALWRLTSPSHMDAVRIDGAATLVVDRAGHLMSGGVDPWVRVGDRIMVSGGPARLSWTTEGTSIELATGSLVAVEALGSSKRLRLDQGALRAVVAPQSAGGGLTVQTPFGSVDVIGTRFSVQVQDHSSAVAVEHGSVRVSASSAASAAPPVTLAAGYAVTVDGATVSAPGPIADLPALTLIPVAPPSERVRLSAANIKPGDGWEGDAIDGAIRGRMVPASAVRRITTPLRRPDGYQRWSSDLRCTLRLSVDQPTTLAILLVCDHPDGGSAWTGNLQSERRIPAGEQEITITAADLRLVTAGTPPPAGSRVVAAAIMCWSPAADLRVQWIEFSR